MANAPAKSRPFSVLAQRIRMALGRIEILALFPLIVISSSLLGFEDIAMVTAVGLTVLLAIGGFGARTAQIVPSSERTSVNSRSTLTATLDRVANLPGRDSACILLQIDDWTVLHDRWGYDTCEDLAKRLEERLQTTLRNGDQLARLSDARFGVVLSPLASARLGLRDTIAGRLADTIAEPLPMRGTALRLTASLGHSGLLKQSVDPAQATFKAAEAALEEAVTNGPAAIRAYAPGMGQARAMQSTLSEEVETAIHDGAISAWFQPQINARTGAIAGMETLARWQHPRHGLLSPDEFFPAVEASGHMPLLGQTMLHQALKAMQMWETETAHIPLITINFSATELRDQELATTLASEVARYDIAPTRVVVDISEDVAKRVEDDAIVATLQAMRDAGHRLDLDGFGLGAASLPTIQRFAVNRIKIDRSFVLDVDLVDSKKQTVTAIIAMANAMGIETIANGVETKAQHDTLLALGCDYLQGFGVARPMGLDKVADWARVQSAVGNTVRLEERRA